MAITRVCCDVRGVITASGTCSSTCCKVIGAWVMDCQYIATETVATAQAGLCALGTMTNWTVTPITQRILHRLDLDSSFANTYKYSTTYNSDKGCVEWSLESEFRVDYSTPDQKCAVHILAGKRNPMVVQNSRSNFAYEILNYTGEATWSFEQDGCKARLKLNVSDGTMGALPLQVGGTDAATATFITNNLSTV